MSGFIAKEAERVVIGVNTDHSENRQRFTIAHELGHLLLHNPAEVHVDRNFKTFIRLRDEVSSQGVDQDEIEANYFAAELLMPKRFLEKDLRDIDGLDLHDQRIIDDLAKRYVVSTQALLLRLAALGYINE
jgi:Zn-dependent peptidase ImmA (M78 family)